MKKFTLLLIILFANVVVFAGTTDKRAANGAVKNLTQKHLGMRSTNARIPSATHHSNVLPFFSQDFGSGTLPATWENIDSSGNGVHWKWTNSGCFSQIYPGFDSLGAVGTSAANGYMMFDSDSSGAQVAGGDWGVIITDSFDCSTHPTVRLSFNQFFAFFENTPTALPNTARIYASLDRLNWTEVYSADSGMVNNDFTPNPNAVEVDLTSIAANQPVVYLKWSFKGDWSYFWYVDDIQISEIPSTDGKVLSVDDPYNACTLSNTEPITISITNNGLSDFSNFSAGFSVGGGSPVIETITDTIHPGDTLIYTFTGTADLSIPGSYDITAFVSITGDINQANDSATVSALSVASNSVYYFMGFEPTDDFSTYLVEDVDGDGSTIDVNPTLMRSGTACLRYLFPPGINNPDNWVITNCFDLQAANTYLIGFWYKVFDLSTGQFYHLEAYIGTAQTHTGMTLLIAAPDPLDTAYTTANTTFTVPSDGSYFIGFRAYGAAVDNTLRVDDIIIDVADKINTVDKSNAVEVYPNPSTGQIFIQNKNLNSQSVSVSVLNPIGQVVYTKQYQNLVEESIDLSNYPAGIYTVRFSSNEGTVNKTVVLSDK